ncbi:MAG: LytTR family DNA-binding domain-containing protein [Bacteroidales bacterium]|nr:LytTR family DNA-binding domain-containing protein [Bacilli bacterium]MDD4739640.1 LytTR family DNA-binding domain-containing protein [Bacteroidales bacterium]
MKVAIVEDETLSQELLQELLNLKFPDFEIVKILNTVKGCIDFFSNTEVDLIFMDIHLKDGDCFDIFKKIDIKTPIIFTTAYDEYAIKAFEVNSLSYILKPITESKIEKIIKKLNLLKLNKRAENISSSIPNISDKQQIDKRITVKLGNKIIVVEQENIAFFVSVDKICFLYTKDKNKYVIDYSLDTLSKKLDPNIFFRISRDCITTFGAIKEITKYFKGRLSISLNPEYNKNFIISQERVHEFMKWIKGN